MINASVYHVYFFHSGFQCINPTGNFRQHSSTNHTIVYELFDLVQLQRGNQRGGVIHITQQYKAATVLVGYELALSKLLKDGSDLWLNNPIVTLEASGTSGMTAAMNGSVNFSTFDGWVCEFAKDGENSFIIPEADRSLSPEARDEHDRLGFYQTLETRILPAYYGENQDDWWKIVLNSMNDVVPFFDSSRMADEYYTKMYLAGE